MKSFCNLKNFNNKIFLFVFVIFFILFCYKNKKKGENETFHEIHWSYGGKFDPSHWGEEYYNCTGKRQSPIDIKQVSINRSIHLDFTNQLIRVVNLSNNGHTLMAGVEEIVTFLYDEIPYKLIQFHFHTPSEHTIDGYHFPMEMHLVHKNKKGGLAVISMMFELGNENAYLAKFWDDLPLKEGQEVKEENVEIDLMAMLEKHKHFFIYDGSLTTPPCSEGVKWFVLSEAIHTSQDEIDKIHEIMGDNARPTQPLNHRKVEEN